MKLKRVWAKILGGIYSRLPFFVLTWIKAIPVRGKMRAVGKMPPIPRTHQTNMGSLRYELDLRNDVDRSIFFHLTEGEVKELVEQVQPGDCVFDVGANIGMATIPLAHATGPEGRVFAFEPDNGNLARLRQNCRLNAFENRVVIMPHAVSDHIGEAFFFPSPPEHSGWGSLAKYDDIAQDPVRVELTTVDEVVRRHKVQGIALMKIDVEGAEGEVLKGAVETLKKQVIRCLAMEINGGRLAEREILACELFHPLLEAGYEPAGPEADHVNQLIAGELPLANTFIPSAFFRPASPPA